MNPILALTAASFTLACFLIVLAAIAWLAWKFPFFSARARRRHFRRVALENENLALQCRRENVRLKADAALAKYLLVKVGSDNEHSAVCGAADRPLGNSDDAPAAAEDPLTVQLFGLLATERIVIASEAIAADVDVYTAASGKVQDLPAVAGTYWRVGRSTQSASGDADKFRIIPCEPEKLVVIAAPTVGANIAAFTGATVGADLGAFTDPPSAGEMAALRTFANALKADHAATLAELATLRTFVNAVKADNAALNTGLGGDQTVKRLA